MLLDNKPWVASQSDILENDWVIVEGKEAFENGYVLIGNDKSSPTTTKD